MADRTDRYRSFHSYVAKLDDPAFVREQLSAQLAHGVATTRRLKEELTQQTQRARMQLKDIQTSCAALRPTAADPPLEERPPILDVLAAIVPMELRNAPYHSWRCDNLRQFGVAQCPEMCRHSLCVSRSASGWIIVAVEAYSPANREELLQGSQPEIRLVLSNCA